MPSVFNPIAPGFASKQQDIKPTPDDTRRLEMRQAGDVEAQHWQPARERNWKHWMLVVVALLMIYVFTLFALQYSRAYEEQSDLVLLDPDNPDLRLNAYLIGSYEDTRLGA